MIRTILCLALFAACGGDDPADNKTADAAPGGGDQDAGPPPVDAEPFTVTLTGRTSEIGLNGETPVSADVALIENDGTEVTRVTSDVNGDFTISTTTTTPVTGYLKATKAGNWDCYLEPPKPVEMNLENALAIFGSDLIWNTFTRIVTGAEHTSGNGIVAVVITNSAGGAEVGATLTNSLGLTVYYPDLDNALQPGSWPNSVGNRGLAVMFNVPDGPITLNATAADGSAMLANDLTVRPDALTATIIVPN